MRHVEIILYLMQQKFNSFVCRNCAEINFIGISLFNTLPLKGFGLVHF